MIVRKIQDFRKLFKNQKKTIHIYMQNNKENIILDKLFEKSHSNLDEVYVYMNKNE